MDEELKKRLDGQDEVLKAIYVSVEKTRKYFLWVMIISLVMLVIPLIGLFFALPGFLGSYGTALGGF